jgi:GNAT superfamily N-acetyltransferase
LAHARFAECPGYVRITEARGELEIVLEPVSATDKSVLRNLLELRHHDYSEFFVLRKYRRQGVGKTAALLIFERYPGPCRVDQEPGNLPAQRFWRRIIGEHTHDSFEESIMEIEGEARPVQRFISRPAGKV